MLKLRPLMSVLLALVVITPASLTLAGCSNSGNATPMDADYLAKAEKEGKEKREIFDRAQGVYESMTPEDRTKFLGFFKGDEANAKKFWDMMAHPPSSMGGPTGTPAPPPGSTGGAAK